MYFALKVFNPSTDLYCWNYFVSDDNEHPWIEAAKYSEFIEACGCPVITIDLCTHDKIGFVMENVDRIVDYNHYDIRGKQFILRTPEWFAEV